MLKTTLTLLTALALAAAPLALLCMGAWALALATGSASLCTGLVVLDRPTLGRLFREVLVLVYCTTSLRWDDETVAAIRGGK